MGHTRVGLLPNVGRWREVMTALGEGATPADELTTLVLDAAADTLARNDFDQPVSASFELLIQMAQAADSPDWIVRLSEVGIEVDERTSARRLVARSVEALRGRLSDEQCSFLGREIALRTFAETLGSYFSAQTGSLLGSDAQTGREWLARLNRGDAFGRISHQYFALLLRRTVAYFASREIPRHVAQNGRFATVTEAAAFEREELGAASYDAAAVVRRFAEEWYGGRLARRQAHLPDVRGFAAYATRKLVGALPAEGDA